jgi:hypothetical protein
VVTAAAAGSELLGVTSQRLLDATATDRGCPPSKPVGRRRILATWRESKKA